MSDVEIEIDGKKLTAKPDAMVIQVADDAGIYIPRFCYHKHLSIAANCRMCLVEVEKSPKALPACATPVMAGMKVFTRSPKALAAQKAVMEFLLINHPLDCPICDQGGECELQDLSMGYGADESFFTEGKRAVKDKDLGPLIATDMTRCIHCTRCVRFGAEVAGFRELGATGRGEHTEIGTYIQHAMHSEVSGNIIDLCPVGALTSKPYRFTARPWELQQFPTIAAHDALGSHLNAHTRNGKVMRMVPRENAAINQTWISDRDRYSYEGLYHPDRLTKPKIRVGQYWQEVDWQAALEVAVQGLQHVLTEFGGDELATLASPNATVEECYLLQKLTRALGSDHIDHRLRQVDFSDQDHLPAFPGLNMPIADLEKCDGIILMGSNIQKEQPMASLRVRKAALKGAKVVAMNMMDYDFHFPLAEKVIAAPQHFVAAISSAVEKTAALFQPGQKVCVLLGAAAFNHPQAADIRAQAAVLAEKTQATLGFLMEGANAAGAWLAGAVPHRQAGGKKSEHAGMNVQQVWQKPRKSYVLLNVEPDVDCVNAPVAMHALEQAEFVVSLSMFHNPVLEQYANVMLPIAPFTETSGTFVNAAGEWQSFQGVATAIGESRPAWKVLRVLANLLDVAGFEYASSEEVREEVKAQCAVIASPAHFSLQRNDPQPRDDDSLTLYRIGDIPLYANDSIVRRAKSLQSTQTIIEGNLAAVRIHPKTALRLDVNEMEWVTVKQQDACVRLLVVLDERLPESAVFIAGGVVETSGLSELFGVVEIIKN